MNTKINQFSRAAMTLLAMLFTSMLAWAQDGNCGDTSVNGGADVTWSYNTTTKTLTISGHGSMMYYGSVLGSDSKYHSTAPWSIYDAEIKNVVVGEGVTYIGSYAFAYCPALTTVSLPTSVFALGDYVCYSSNVSRINIPYATAAATIGTGGFEYCSDDLQIAVPAHLLKTYKDAANWSAYATKMVGVLDDAHGFAISDNPPTGNYEYTRTFKCGVAATLCLPYEISSGQASAYGQFYTFAGVDKSGEKWVVVMEEANRMSDALAPHTPYMFLPYIFDGKSKGDDLPITFSGNVSSIAAAGNTVWNEGSTGFWSFQGVTYNYSWNEGHEDLGRIYGFAAQNYDGGSYTVSPGDFVKAAAGASIAPFRAYLVYTATGGAKRRVIGEPEEFPSRMSVRLINADGSATVIGTIDTKTGEITMDANWYDLNGHQLEGEPITSGIYIKNGKKIYVK